MIVSARILIYSDLSLSTSMGKSWGWHGNKEKDAGWFGNSESPDGWKTAND